jgi:hypothetical protein
VVVVVVEGGKENATGEGCIQSGSVSIVDSDKGRCNQMSDTSFGLNF